MLNLRYFAGILLALAVATHAAPTDDFPTKLLSKLRTLAGKDALDCGAAGIGQSTAIVNNCALKAFRNRRSFYFHYYLQGIDTWEAAGFAGDRFGNVYKASSWIELPSQDDTAGIEHPQPEHVSVEKCSKPVNLRVANGGLLTCFLRDP